MRFIFIAISLALLVVASADVDQMDKFYEELQKLELQQKSQRNHDVCKANIELAAAIVDKRVANQTEMDKWSNFYNYWAPQDESYLQDDLHVEQCIEQFDNMYPMALDMLDYDSFNIYSGGILRVLENKLLEREQQRKSLFRTRATDIAKEVKKLAILNYRNDWTLDFQKKYGKQINSNFSWLTE